MKDKTLISSAQRRSFLFVIGILFLFYPYMFPDLFMPFMDSSLSLYVIVGGITFGLNIVSPKKATMPWEFWIPVFVMLFGSMVAFLHSGGRYYWIRCLMLFTSCNLIYFVHSRIGLFPFFKVYNRWIYIMALGGVIGLALSVIGMPPLIKTIAMNDGRPFYSWLVTCAKPVGDTRFIRYSGFFDEPGAMAYWGVFAIAINKLFIHDKRNEWPLITLLLFTFSAGFYIQIIVYIAFFLLKGSSRSRRIIVLFSFMLIIGAAYFTKGTSLNDIYEITFGRFEGISVGEGENLLQGTNRNALAARAYYIWRDNPVWGLGWVENSIDMDYFLDNPYETLATDGILGFIYINFPLWWLIILSIRKRDFTLLGVALFCSVSLIHRPVHANMLTYFILYSLPCMYGLRTNKENDSRRYEIVQAK